jgi:hypothetical protein
MTYYAITNFITGKPDLCDTEEKASEIAAQNKAALLEREAYRFTIAKVVVSGPNTTWTNADFDNDPEETVYQVFNTLTGQHEEVATKTSAIARKDEIQQEFLKSAYPTDWREISDIEYERLTSPYANTIQVTVI